jgi:hypothetical protein
MKYITLTFLSGMWLAAGCERGPDAATPATEESVPAPAAITPDRWSLAPDSYGPLRVGMTRDALATLIPGTFTLAAPAEPGGCGYAEWDGPPGVRLMFTGDTLVRIEADSAVVITGDSARVWDAEARIDSIYKARVRRVPHKYTDGRYLIIVAEPPADTLHRIVFETDGARVTKLRAGRMPEVEYVEGCS